MDTLPERAANLWQQIKGSTPRLPSRIMLPPSQVESKAAAGSGFEPNRHYFQVRINQMYLRYDRQWFKEYDPMVFIVSEFTYDKKVQAVPFIVGPAMLEQYGQPQPDGMLFSDTRVAGLHPYRGGRLNLSLVLCKVTRKNYARQFLQLVETAAGVLDFSTALSTYVKIADVILTGVESLFGSGDSQPVIGFRKEFDPAAGDELAPNFYALIDLPSEAIDLSQLWVRDNQLLAGPTRETAKPFKQADFVLFSLAQVAERDDVTTLPFYPLWERVKQDASTAREESWKSAKVNMASLYQSMLLSPDLTNAQAEALTEEYIESMNIIHKQAVRISNLGPGDTEADEMIARSMSILDL